MARWGKKQQGGAGSPDEAPGWNAITSATQAAGLAAPLHFGTANLPDQDGAYALNAHRVPEGWLLMTLGLTELFGKVSDDTEVSGWGFELTLRAPAEDDGTAPPAWAMDLLLQLARYVYGQGRPFEAGHRMSPGGPITGAPGTLLTALAFTSDPLLTRISTPHGSVDFLTVVGITQDELERMQASSTAAVLDVLRQDDPLLVTDPDRA